MRYNTAFSLPRWKSAYGFMKCAPACSLTRFRTLAGKKERCLLRQFRACFGHWIEMEAWLLHCCSQENAAHANNLQTPSTSIWSEKEQDFSAEGSWRAFLTSSILKVSLDDHGDAANTASWFNSFPQGLSNGSNSNLDIYSTPGRKRFMASSLRF